MTFNPAAYPDYHRAERVRLLTDANGLYLISKNAPFRITVLTPFGRAVVAVSEAKRKFLEAPTLSVAELNAEGLVISVADGQDFRSSNIIEDLVIKKGEVVIRPVKKEVIAAVVQNLLGASRASAEGKFYFRLDSIPVSPFRLSDRLSRY